MELLEHGPVVLTVDRHHSAVVILKPERPKRSLSGIEGAEACDLRPFRVPLSDLLRWFFPTENVVVVVDGTVPVEMDFITEPDQVDPVWVPLHPLTEPIAHIKSPSHVILTQFMPNRDDVWEKLQFLSEDMPD